jgi:hypothetical protein
LSFDGAFQEIVDRKQRSLKARRREHSRNFQSINNAIISVV